MQKNEIGPLSSPDINTKIKFTSLIHFELRPNTIKLLEENIGGKLHDIGFDNDFLDMTPQTQATKANIGLPWWRSG